jgi:hypothetical protein
MDCPQKYLIVSKSTGVMALFGMGPLHLVIDLVVVVPSGFVNTRVPQKAKDVRVDPVLLLIDKNKCLVIILPATQDPQASSPAFCGSVAPTNIRSPDVHEVAGGSVWARLVETEKTDAISSSSSLKSFKSF